MTYWQNFMLTVVFWWVVGISFRVLLEIVVFLAGLL